MKMVSRFNKVKTVAENKIVIGVQLKHKLHSLFNVSAPRIPLYLDVENEGNCVLINKLLMLVRRQFKFHPGDLSMSKTLFRFVILICFLLVQGFSGPTWADSNSALDRVIESRQLRVGMSGNQPPMNVKSRTGAFIGLEVDLANQIADLMGVKLTMVPTPFPELLEKLDSGEVDMVMSNMSITPDRAVNVTFVGPYILSGKSILTKSANLALIKNSTELNNADITVVSLANSTSQQFVEKSLKSVKSVTTQNYEDAIQMVKDDEADAMVADMIICILAVKQNPMSGLTTLKTTLTTEPIGIAVSSADTQFSNLVQNYLDTLEHAGVLEQLSKKWLEDDSWIKSLP
jgi:polar amino acid transport system substrate-binding protein